DGDLDEDDLETDDLETDDIDEGDLETDALDVAVEGAEDFDLDAGLEVGSTVGTATDTATESEDDDSDVLEIDDELHPDDVEAPLDALLQERVASTAIDEDEEEIFDEDETETDDRGDGPTKIVPRRPGEFLCSSCFLVMPRHMLADEARSLCRDCA
ncbi:MAG: DUF4193 family protein, partial [Acidimicrobiia bacterium]